MPIPNINLIPPAYYLRKKARAAAIIASLLLLIEVAALVAFAVMQSQKNKELQVQRDEWQQKAQLVQAENAKAESIRASVVETKTKTDFIREVFAANDNWPTIFDQIRDYSYPRARYTSMAPTAGTNLIRLNITVPDVPQLDAQRAMTLYWSNLLRSPIVKTATVDTFLPYRGADDQSTTSSGLPMPGGGPPMPGGPPVGPPMPGGPPVGPPMPGGPPQGRWLGSPSQVASPALEALGGAESNLIQMLSPGGGGLTPDALRQFGIVPPTPPPLRPFVFTAELTKTFTVPEFRAPAAAQQQPAEGVIADDFTPTPIT